MNLTAFYSNIRSSIFKGKLTQTQVEGMDIIIDTWFELYPHQPLNQLAYILATAYHETAHTMQPVRETLAKTDAEAIRRLEKAYHSGKLKSVKTPYWNTGFFGRGYVQLTHKYNYEKAGKELGINLVSNPEKVMEPNISAQILIKGSIEGWFTSKRLGVYITHSKSDYINARRVINGTDKAKLIAGYAESFSEALRELRSTRSMGEVRVDGKKPLQSTTVASTAAQAAVGVGTIGVSGLPSYIIIPACIIIGLLAGYVISERLRHSREEGI
jgi:hypothetical protein